MATLEITESREVNAVKLTVDAEVRYWEDATVNGVEDEDGTLIPFRVGDSWSPSIDIDTGVICDWPQGTVASIHYKVCDAGVYSLLDADGVTLKHIEGYVPKILSPGGSGYGDYIIMNVDETGRIDNWHVDLSPFEDGDQ